MRSGKNFAATNNNINKNKIAAIKVTCVAGISKIKKRVMKTKVQQQYLSLAGWGNKN